MLITGIVLLTGVTLACYAPQLIDRYWVSWIPVCLFVAYFNPRLKHAGLLLGSFLWATAMLHWQLDHRLSVEHNNKRLVVIGEVLNIPKVSSVATRFLFKPISIEGYKGNLAGKVRLSWSHAPDNLRPGQVWQLFLRLKQPHGFQNPGGFDYERWMFARGIQATGYVVKSAHNILQSDSQFSLNSLRYSIKQQIEESCQSCQNSGLIQALALGYRGNIPHQTRSLLNQTGTAHLIAVSGLHIGIVAAVFYSLGLLLWSLLFYSGRLKRKEFSLLLGWLAGLCYGLLAGFDLPAQRAMLMLTVIFLSLLFRSPFNLLHSISTALVLVIIVSPLAVLSASFWLTFSALMIIAFGSFLLQTQSSRIKQMVIIQLLFSILFIPLSIFIFGQVHSASMAANLIAVPLVSFIIVPLNFVLLILLWLPQPLLQALYSLLNSLLGVLIDYLNWLQNIGLQAIPVAEMDGLKLILILLFVILLLIPKGLFPRALLLFLLPPIVLWNPHRQTAQQLTMTVLDVGMGTAIVLQTAHHSLIVDFGPGNKRGYSLGEWVVLPFMHAAGIAKPDRIVISHADQDHAGGFYALQDDYKGVPLYSGTPPETRKKFPQLAFIRDCHRTEGWLWDGVKFEFLTNQGKFKASENNRSCVLKVTFGQNSILLPGDIEQQREQALIKNDRQLLNATFLVAPHHGSLTSSSEAFIKSVGADHIIFTVGYLNRWKFPRAEIVQRYTKTKSQVMQTDKTGAIRVSCSEINCQLEKYRQQHPHIWY